MPLFFTRNTSLLVGRWSAKIEKFVKWSKQKCKYSTLKGGINDRSPTLVLKIEKKRKKEKQKDIWVQGEVYLGQNTHCSPTAVFSSPVSKRQLTNLPLQPVWNSSFHSCLSLKVLELWPLRDTENRYRTWPGMGPGQAPNVVTCLFASSQEVHLQR